MIWDNFLSIVGENTATITSLVSIITVGIWGFYAHLLYRDYRNRNHPRILIQQVPDSSGNSRCLLINMSEKILNVPCIFVLGYGENDHIYKMIVSDYEQFATEIQTGQVTPIENIQQSTLSPGDFICLGRFSSLLHKLKKSDDYPINILEIRVVAFFGAMDKPIGAYRRFYIKSKNEQLIIAPNRLNTKQMISFLQKRKIKGWIDDCLKSESE
ncbi:hypothetical protein [Methanolobus bombayensis]|uniref:hypothetical protein n=1 Tax=Methanolobus bombayensis TaxID=38023 RepID=UPI001AEAE86D|nr:hypothetical protein [Methanolobus bombayensis]MBP1908503.1 hypothetical protein [Methanolobus bombayensis]